MQCGEVVQKALSELSNSFRCIPYDKRLCIVTPYLYPDNDLIEVFVEELAGEHVIVTDMGETLRHLASQGIDVLNSPKRRFMLEQIAKRLHVQVVGGRLEKDSNLQEVGAVLLDVAAAAHGVAGLAYTSKTYEPAEFPEEVAAFLSDNNIKHEPRPRIKGMSGKEYRVSLRVNGAVRPEILIEAMSPSQESVMSAVVNRVVREWVDIGGERRKVSLLNDTDFHWRPPDIFLLGKLSTVHKWSEKDAFLKFVKELASNASSNQSPINNRKHRRLAIDHE